MKQMFAMLQVLQLGNWNKQAPLITSRKAEAGCRGERWGGGVGGGGGEQEKANSHKNTTQIPLSRFQGKSNVRECTALSKSASTAMHRTRPDAANKGIMRQAGLSSFWHRQNWGRWSA